MSDPRHGAEWFSKNLLDVLPSAVYVCSLDGVIVAFNDRASDIWGQAPRLGQTDERFCGSHRLFRADGSYMPHDKTPMEAVLRTGAPAPNCEVIIEQPNGTRVPVLVNIAPLFDDAGVQIGAVNCFQDLTSQKQAERERLELSEALRQSQKMEAIGQLTGGVAHDFNNLLMAIQSSVMLLAKKCPDDPQIRRLIDNAMQGVERGAALTQRMLSFARRQELKVEKVDPINLVRNLIELLQQTIGSAHPLHLELPATLGAVEADVNQLEMALLNLAVNARDAMPDGGTIAILASEEEIGDNVVASLPAGHYVKLSVVDTGVGMDPTILARATEPFFTTKAIGKGTGLGLSMIFGLAEQMHGTLCLQSTVGQGTTVDLWLPAVASGDDERVETPIVVQAVSGASRPLKILAVDDDSLILMNISALLEDLGHEVIEAMSGAEALDRFAEHSDIDILITDQGMPNMTGAKLAEHIREIRPNVPIIIASGYCEPRDALGTTAKLIKPFNQAQLSEALTMAMGNNWFPPD